MTLQRQAEELVLLRCSLLPQEILEFVLSPDDLETCQWAKIVNAGSEGELVPYPPPCPAHFVVKIQGCSLWFEFQLSDRYPEEPTEFHVMVRGYGVSRAEQERWQDIVQAKHAQLNSNRIDFPIFELITTHLLPLLHTEFDSKADVTEGVSVGSNTSSESPVYAHALLTSHHLKSLQKRRSLQQWSSELRLSGFAKIGHPGIIYCSGIQSDVAEFVSRVKDMQWLALRVRFEEPLSSTERPRESWLEVQKVGDVVEEMKRLGRESYVLDLGIGSGSRPG